MTAVKSTDKQHIWEKNWSTVDYSPPWLTDEPPEELRRTVLSDGFPKGGSVLDIGCGNGAIAAWLAQQNFSVLGIDFSHAAVQKAMLGFGNVPKLKFQTVDVCEDRRDIGRFDGLFDRGCLHTIPPRSAAQYAANVANWSRQGTLFLLIHKTPARENETVLSAQQRVRGHLGKLFRPWFSLKGIRSTAIRGGSGQNSDWEMPCLAIWMTRR